MNNINIKIYAWFLIVLVLTTWLILILIKEHTLTFTWDALFQIPRVISINVFIWLVFIKWIWKWKILRGWLVPFPDLSGTWKGQAIPKSINPQTKQQYAPVDLEANIIQTFLSIHIRIFSNEMESNSYTASFKLDITTDEKRLCYSYLSKPKANIRDRSPIHDGTALLTIKDENGNKLEGEYWTNRLTSGEMYLERQK